MTYSTKKIIIRLNVSDVKNKLLAKPGNHSKHTRINIVVILKTLKQKSQIIKRKNSLTFVAIITRISHKMIKRFVPHEKTSQLENTRERKIKETLLD